MKYAKIGGQAVIEGVMMRYGNQYAVTVRKPDGMLETKKDVRESLTSRLHLQNVPIVRGIFSFIDSMVLGISTMTWSAGFYDEDGNPVEQKAADAGKTESASAGETNSGKADKNPKADKDSKTDKDSWKEKVLMGGTVALSLVLAVGVFMVLPFLISSLFKFVTDSSWVLGIVEGIVRVILFFGYILLISRMEDIQRVFMYHGAEHKSISCIEHGDELTPANAMKYSRLHKRCGTSFLFLVIIISIIFFIMFFQIFPVENIALKVIIRILLVPVIAGVSYEILQWAGRSDNWFTNLISMPGMALQKLTTREPDEAMLEAAIASIEAIYDWRAFQEEVRQEQNGVK